MLLLFGMTLLLGSEKVVTLKEENRYLLGEAISYYEDREGALGYPDVREKNFASYDGPVPSFGFTSSVYWFKAIIEVEEKALEHKWWLNIDYPPLDYVDVYVENPEGELTVHYSGGELRPFALRELNMPSFLFKLKGLEAGKSTIYIKVRTDGSLQLPVMIEASEHMLETQLTPLILAGLYYGIFVIIFFYNAVMYYYTRELNYPLYLLFIASFVFWQLSFDGFGVQFIWTDWQWMHERSAIIAIACVAVTSLLFGRHFLHTKAYIPKMDTLLHYLMFFSLATLIAAFILPYKYVVLADAFLAAFIPIIMLVTGILVWKKKYKPARFYILGWSAFLLGTFLLALNKFNVFQGFYILNYVQQVGSALEMIFLSWALADRIQLLQSEYVGKLNSLNKTLNNRIAEGLDEAREKDRILIQQSRLASMGEMIEQIAHQWRQPLHTMALVNQDLYFKVKLGFFNKDEIETVNQRFNENLQYMSKTIDDFRDFYKIDRKKERCEAEEVVRAALTLSDAMLKYAKIDTEIINNTPQHIDIIRNELIQVFMNLFKNARDVIIERKVFKGYIKVLIEGDADNVRIIFEDNGGGIDEENIENVFNPYFTTKESDAGTGIGLYMSRGILEKNMNGSIAVENGHGGARFTITLPASKRSNEFT